jgi:uncharacterized LabA/DUF88 family protein
MNSPIRTIVYVDGFNLYYGQLKGKSGKWLDLVQLVQNYLQPSNQIVSLKYLTALVQPRPSQPNQHVRQQTYIRAIETNPLVEVIYGKYLSHQVYMPRCDGNGKECVIKTEEKMTDVNIAVHILNDAFQNSFDLAVLISNDSDLSEPLRMVRSMGKMVGILNPHKNPSRQLSKYATFQKTIRHSAILASQMPNPITDSNGNSIHKPKEWK